MIPSFDADGAIEPKAPLLRVREDVADDGGINSGNGELTTAEAAMASPRSQLLRKSRSRYEHIIKNPSGQPSVQEIFI